MDGIGLHWFVGFGLSMGYGIKSMWHLSKINSLTPESLLLMPFFMAGFFVAASFIAYLYTLGFTASGYWPEFWGIFLGFTMILSMSMAGDK